MPADAQARIRQLASNVTFRESLGKANSIIVPFNDAGSSVPLYCVHSLSGKATDYSALALMLGPDQPFYALQVPFKNRDTDFGGDICKVSIPQIARHYAEALQRFQPEGPFALGGWSYGVILAFEMAQQLRAMGREVALLVAFDLVPLNVNAPANRITFASEVLWTAPRWIRAHPLVREKGILAFAGHTLGKAAGIAQRRFTGAPSEPVGDTVDKYVRPEHYPPAHLALMQTMLDVAALYVPQRYDGAVQVYAATSEVPISHAACMRRDWRALAPRAEVRAVSGTHRSMIEDRDGQALARHLYGRLAALSQ